jgi:hypothetical protein
MISCDTARFKSSRTSLASNHGEKTYRWGEGPLSVCSLSPFPRLPSTTQSACHSGKLTHGYHYKHSCEQSGQTDGGKYWEVRWKVEHYSEWVT